MQSRIMTSFCFAERSPHRTDTPTPIEAVIVNASALTGIWKIGNPESVEKTGFFSAP